MEIMGGFLFIKNVTEIIATFLVPLLDALVTFLSNCELDSVSFGQADVGFVAFANDENITHAGGESVTIGVLKYN